jgi:hypothetical protein
LAAVRSTETTALKAGSRAAARHHDRVISPRSVLREFLNAISSSLAIAEEGTNIDIPQL